MYMYIYMYLYIYYTLYQGYWRVQTCSNQTPNQSSTNRVFLDPDGLLDAFWHVQTTFVRLFRYPVYGQSKIRVPRKQNKHLQVTTIVTFHSFNKMLQSSYPPIPPLLLTSLIHVFPCQTLDKKIAAMRTVKFHYSCKGSSPIWSNNT